MTSLDDRVEAAILDDGEVPAHLRIWYDMFFLVSIIASFGIVQLGLFPGFVAKMIWPALIVAGGCLLLLTPTSALARARVNLPLVGFMCWIMMSVAWTTNMSEWKLTTLRASVLGVVTMLLVSVVSIESFLRAMRTATIIAVGGAFLGALVRPGTTTVHLDPVTNEFMFAGWRGTFDHKSGMMMFLCVGAATFLCFERKPAVRRGMVAAIILLAVLSQSATGLAVLAAVLLVNWALIRAEIARQRQSPFPLYMTAIALVLLVTILFTAPLLVNLYGKDLTFTGRTNIWAVSIDTAAQRPWAGYGFGAVFIDATTEPTASMIRKIGFAAGNPHEGYIDIALQLGLIGLGLYVLSLVSILFGIRRCRAVDPVVARWALTSIVAIILFSLSEAATFGGYWTLVVVLSVLHPRPSVSAAAT